MYCKLFASLYQGTLRGKSNEILVFTNLLAHCDRDGFVDKHFKAIADEVGISEDEARAAVEALERSDPESRSPDQGGARIVRMDEHRAWGWQVVNYAKYCSMRNQDDRREQNRRAQANRRAKKAGKSESQSQPESAEHKRESSESAHIDVDVDVDRDINNTPIAPKGGGGGKSRTPTSDIAKRLAALFNRRESTEWSQKEIRAFRDLGEIDPEELALVEGFFAAEKPKGRDGRQRRDLYTLLNNFRGEIDKARFALTSKKRKDSPI